jgi:hypothetical protein
MGAATQDFKRAAARALADPALQKALLNVKRGFVAKREAARADLPEFDALRDEARAIKDHALAHLDLYLEAYERKVTESGGEVHYARDAAEARAIVLRLCEAARARIVAKGKSMVSEEIVSTPISKPQASRWSKPISANMSRKRVASGQATSSRRSFTSTKRASSVISATSIATCRRSGSSTGPSISWPKRARSCANNS